MKKQSSIGWLACKFATTDIEEFQDYFNEFIEQAKEKHKQEIIEAFDRGLITDNVYYGYDDKKAERFYKNTYEKEN